MDTVRCISIATNKNPPKNGGQLWVTTYWKLHTVIVMQLYCTLKNKKPCHRQGFEGARTQI